MLNYRHLYYFWMVAREGGFARAAERLDMAIQTVSSQVRALETALGHQLLKPEGRGVALTDAGRAAFARAEEIFRLGLSLPEAVRAAATPGRIRLAIGLTDGISKLAAHALLAPVLDTPALHLVCHEGEMDELLAELALHRLDLVLAGQAPSFNPNLRLASDCLVSSPVDWFGPARWVDDAAVAGFPAVLAQLPVLLPTRHARLRHALEQWFDSEGLNPQVVGEFEDSALMAVFAARGLGVFPISRFGADEPGLLAGLRLLGPCEAVRQEIHAIRNQRGAHHPLVRALLDGARAWGQLSADQAAGTSEKSESNE